jgi:glycosyltransferase involved in cell wall biosynthesis
MVLLEAIACSTPIISTDCRSGPHEILDNGKCGLLVPLDKYALSGGIMRLLRDDALRQIFSRLGKEQAKDFSVDKIIKQYERVICESLTD